MLEIDRIVLHEIELALVEPFRISSGTSTRRRILLLHLYNHPKGRRGGASAWPGRSPTTARRRSTTAWLALCEWIGPRVLGRRFAGPEEIQPVLDRGLPRPQHGQGGGGDGRLGARGAGARRRARLPPGRPTRAAHPGGDLDRPSRRARRRWSRRPGAVLAQGYQKVKMKIQPGADLPYVRAVREGPGAGRAADGRRQQRLIRLDDPGEPRSAGPSSGS